MSFNIDDPLAGILSDGSDDSFFDDDIIGKKKPKKTTPIAEKKNALFDLGDGDKSKVSAENKASFDNEIPSLGKVTSTLFEDEKPAKVDTTVKSPTPFKRTLSKESIKFTLEPKTKSGASSKSPAKTKTSLDKLDFLDDIIEPSKDKKPLVKGKSSQSLLDDILGGPSKSGPSNLSSRPTTAPKFQDPVFDALAGKSELKQTGPTKNTPLKQTPTEPPKEEVKKSKPTDDWLGIFQNKDLIDDEEDDTGMPAWLVGDKKKKSEAKTVKKETVRETPKVNDNHEPSTTKTEPQVETDQLRLPSLSISAPVMPVLTVPKESRVVHSTTEDVTIESAALYLEQQDSQLMLALQLKAQEEKLAAMQSRQKDVQRIQREATAAQHQQVDAMLQRQQQQRRQMQAIIASHQERITQRIKELLGTANINDEDQANENNDDNNYNETERRESPHLKEKKQLLQLVQSLQENHDKEIDLMETSYRRQLAFLEISVSQSEERMKDESDKIIKFYTEKINWLEEHHILQKKLADENVNALTERHKSEIDILRQQHMENIRILQEHHAVLMENMKNAVKQEQVLIQDSASFSSNLHTLVTDVKENKSLCQILVEKIQALADNTQQETERTLQARETQVNELMQQLKKEREYFETEKSDGREVIKILENRLKQTTMMMEEEAATIRQKKMEFEFEKATFNKQTEFAKNVLKKQEEEIKMIREDIQKKYQEKMEKIDEEKTKIVKDSATVAKEKISIQNLKQELETTKAELHAQLEELSEERTKLNIEKQQIHMEEQRVLAKSRDLDLLAKAAIEKHQQADKKYAEAEFLQKRYEERIRRMQDHAVSLANREKQIAKEKIVLSRERLNLHNEKKNLEGRPYCSLCKPPQSVPMYNFEPTYTMPEPFLNIQGARDYSAGNTTPHSLYTFEQKIANFMEKNAKPPSAVTDIHLSSRFDEREMAGNLQPSQSVQAEPSSFKDYMDPKFMMLRLDVQQVLSNLERKKDDEDNPEPESEKD